MPFIEIDQDAIDKDRVYNTLFPPDWYRVKINRTVQSLSKNGDSTNFNVEGTVLFNATNGSEDFKGLPTPRWSFNSKAPGFCVGLFKACGIEIKPGRLDFDSLNGKEVDVFIGNREYENKMRNDINHTYRVPRNGQ